MTKFTIERKVQDVTLKRKKNKRKKNIRDFDQFFLLIYAYCTLCLLYVLLFCFVLCFFTFKVLSFLSLNERKKKIGCKS